MSLFNPDTLTKLTAITQPFRTTPQLTGMLSEFADWWSFNHPTLRPSDLGTLHFASFIAHTSAQLGDAIDLSFFDAQVDTARQESIDIWRSVQSTYTLPQDPTRAELYAFLQRLYVDVQKLTDLRDGILHFSTVISYAEDFCKTLDTRLRNMIEDLHFYPANFKHLSERTRFYDANSTNLTTYLLRLSNLRKDVGSLAGSTSSRLDHLFRLEASARMMTNYARAEAFGNYGQSQADTLPPVEDTTAEHPTLSVIED